jgi:uncharacterized protein YeaO (DUF488 family)
MEDNELISWEQIVSSLSQNYAECYHEEENYNQEKYDEELDDMDEEELLELYNSTYDTEWTLDRVVD